MMNARKFVTARPVMTFFIMAILVVVFGYIPITIWSRTTKNITNDVALLTEDLRSSLVSEIESIGNFTFPKTNPSTIGLARVVDSHLTTNNDTEIQTKIAPVLFEAYSMVPQVSQVSYFSTDGLLFSYITEGNTCVAIFTNSSLSGGDYTWYTQTVDKVTGRLIENATKSQPFDVTRTDWFQAALENYTTAFVGTGLGGEDNETLFQTVVSLNNKKGVVSLGFPVKTLTGVLNRLNLHDGELYLWTEDGKMLVREGSLNASSFISNGLICFGRESKSARSQCILGNCTSGGYSVEINGSKFQAFCSVLEVSGVPLRYTLMFPNKGGPSMGNAGMYMLIVTVVLGVLYPLGFLMFMVQASRREMHIRARLINQMEATQQAERKSMNKSQAFATASHDIRGSLAGITGLIDLCREEVKPGSELDTSLQQVNVCTKELVELLNSVLDMSKIESGKMQLEEEDFNMAKLLEDVTDFFHPVAMKKGVDVVMDLNDGSIFKFSNVVGDSGKLKQILNNLISNAVKFTFEGHISIRAWAQRPGAKRPVVMPLSPDQGRVSKFTQWIFCKDKDESSTYEMEISNSIRNNANTMEFVFEVDDTGKGIPMDMRKSVFENYVQVRETARGTQGTGLGLGIVQSLVRLMGGEIRIIDKPIGEKGTCFQFSVLLPTSETPASEMRIGQDTEAGVEYVSTPNLGLTINTSLGSNMNIRNLSPRFNNCLTSSPKLVGSRVVLLLRDEERRRVTEKYIKSLGVKVTTVEKWGHLSQALERLFGSSPQNSMGNETSSQSSRESPLIAIDGIDSRSQIPKKRSNSFSSVVLLLIDAKAGPFSELYSVVEQYRRSLQQNICCKVVWLNDTSGNGSERGDISFSKPLQGSRLNRVLKMLPEFGGSWPKDVAPTDQLLRPSDLVGETSPRTKMSEIQEEGDISRYNKKIGKTIMAPSTPLEREIWINSVRTDPKAEQGTSSSKKNENGFLSGKRVLVVDDNHITCSIAARKLGKMGASEIKQCNEGKEAVKIVREWFKEREDNISTHLIPFDYIFMDCQMPEMDGYEATREIRKVESEYGVHIPIIAVSGHEHGSKEAKETIEAGMDAFLEKNLNQDKLVNIIREIESKMFLNYY